jgi:hypothetical protein
MEATITNLFKSPINKSQSKISECEKEITGIFGILSKGRSTRVLMEKKLQNTRETMTNLLNASNNIWQKNNYRVEDINANQSHKMNQFAYYFFPLFDTFLAFLAAYTILVNFWGVITEPLKEYPYYVYALAAILGFCFSFLGRYVLNLFPENTKWKYWAIFVVPATYIGAYIL